jgi:general secretion pathway protein C
MDRGRGSYAVIEDKKATGQNLYRVGDRVQDALIKMILREGVVLDVGGGKDEILQIEEMAAASGGVRTTTVAALAESLAPTRV